MFDVYVRHNGVHTVMLSICTSHVKKRACHMQMSLSNSQHDDVVGRNHTVMHVPAMLKERACDPSSPASKVTSLRSVSVEHTRVT